MGKSGQSAISVGPAQILAALLPRRRLPVGVCGLLLALSLSGCTSLPEYIHNGFKVGPNYVAPTAPVANEWIDASDKRLRPETEDLSRWWNVFQVPDPDSPLVKIDDGAVLAGVGALWEMPQRDKVPDPVLHDLVLNAYRQNLTLREAGFRIMQARAQLKIAVGSLFPQTQTVTGNYATTEGSHETSGSAFSPPHSFGQWNYGFNLAWEVDFWGRYRRAIESARANLEFSVFDYDDALVTLISDVATNYVNYRVTQERIRYARKNVELQDKTWRIALARINADNDGELSVDQARTLLKQTEATIPAFEITLRTTANQLCILLGIPPEDLHKKLGAGPVPVAPVEAAVGVPADLLRRRPDVRRAERQAAAQSALIGVADADLYPLISLTGSLGYSAQEFKNLFTLNAIKGTVGPSYQWNVLNYGRILNNVRYHDAKFQELATAYQQAVLTAQQETEDGLVTFLKAQQQTKLQAESEEYAKKGESNVRGRYELGLENFTRVTQLQQLLVQEQDLLAQAQGEIALGLIQVYRALGGGWELRFAPPAPTSQQWTAPAPIPAPWLSPTPPTHYEKRSAPIPPPAPEHEKGPPMVRFGQPS